ncbi:MAG: hypothetical protein IKF91_04290 [Bacilli bacterium]|nr:hypothetical protein [Bacilli bacterium]
MYLNEEDNKRLKKKILIGGFSSYETDYFNSNSYRSLRQTMLENLPHNNFELNIPFCPKNEIIKAGRYIIDKHFGNLDLRVRFADGDDMESQLYAIFGPNPTPDKYEDIIRYLNNQIRLLRVTDIPVYLNCSHKANGYVSSTYFYEINDMEEEYFKKLPDCVREIGLEGPCNEDTKCTYVHEMAHALINRHKGSIQNLLNTEAFSIFMEKVAAGDLDSEGKLLDFKEIDRLLQIKQNILDNEVLEYNERNFLGALQDKQYIISTLHATALFNTYSKSNKKVKKEIDTSLGKVICGEETLESVLDRYEASLDRGTRIMNRQIKEYQKRLPRVK